MCGTHNAKMTAAPAKVFIKGRTNLCIRGMMILPKQLSNQHDHTARAISTLSRLFIEKGLLYRM